MKNKLYRNRIAKNPTVALLALIFAALGGVSGEVYCQIVPGVQSDIQSGSAINSISYQTRRIGSAIDESRRAFSDAADLSGKVAGLFRGNRKKRSGNNTAQSGNNRAGDTVNLKPEAADEPAAGASLRTRPRVVAISSAVKTGP